MNDILNHARDVLEAAGIKVTETRELPTGLGHQLRCAGGQIAVVYNSGAVVAQGKETARVKALFAATLKTPRPSRPAARPSASALPVRADATPEPAELEARVPANWSTEPWDGLTPPF